jgi:hypothetical protein
MTAMVTTAPAGVQGPPRPDGCQRAALRGILAEVHRPAPDCPLTLVYGPDRRTEAAWLCAFARAAGTRVRFAARNEHAKTERAALEASARIAAGSGTAVIVISDRTLTLPAGALALPAVPGVNAVDLWEPSEWLALQARRFLGALGPRVTVRSGHSTPLTASVGPGRPGDPFGCVDAEALAVSGGFVADVAIDVNRAVGWDARLAGRPVTLAVRDGRVVSVDCGDPALRGFLTRAVQVHRSATVGTMRFGLRSLPRDAGPIAGPAHRCRANTVTLCLGVDPDEIYSPASADLRIELTGNCGDLS